MVGDQKLISQEQNQITLVSWTFKDVFDGFELKRQIVSKGPIQPQMRIFVRVKQVGDRT